MISKQHKITLDAYWQLWKQKNPKVKFPYGPRHRKVSSITSLPERIVTEYAIELIQDYLINHPTPHQTKGNKYPVKIAKATNVNYDCCFEYLKQFGVYSISSFQNPGDLVSKLFPGRNVTKNPLSDQEIWILHLNYPELFKTELARQSGRSFDDIGKIEEKFKLFIPRENHIPTWQSQKRRNIQSNPQPIVTKIHKQLTSIGTQVTSVETKMDGVKVEVGGMQTKLDIILGFHQKVGETVERESALSEEQNKLSQDRKKLYEEFKNQFPA